MDPNFDSLESFPKSNNLELSQTKGTHSNAEVCPWDRWHTTFGPPNVRWCEARNCSFIQEPANTWSNLSYIFIAFVIFLKFKEKNWKVARELGLVTLFLGLFSFVYHASNNFFTQILDFLGMYLFTSYLLAFETKKLFPKIGWCQRRLYWIYLFANSLLFWIFHLLKFPIQLTILLQILVILYLEFKSLKNLSNPKPNPSFLTAMAFFFCAQVFSVLDLTRIICQPENHLFQGHAIWHILGAIGIYFLGKHIVESST